MKKKAEGWNIRRNQSTGWGKRLSTFWVCVVPGMPGNQWQPAPTLLGDVYGKQWGSQLEMTTHAEALKTGLTPMNVNMRWKKVAAAGVDFAFSAIGTGNKVIKAIRGAFTKVGRHVVSNNTTAGRLRMFP